MIAALRYEWTRLRTLRSTWWLTLGSLLVGVGFTFFASLVIWLNARDEIDGLPMSESWSRYYVDAAMTQFSSVDPMFYLVAFVVAIIGALAWGHEYRHGMVRATLTAVPNRTAVFAAKFLVVGGWVAGVVVTSCLLSLLVSGFFFLNLDIDYDLAGIVGTITRHVVYSVLLTWIVMAVTSLVRHQTFSLVLLFLWPMGIEPLIKLFARIAAALSGSVGISDETGEIDTGWYGFTRFLPFNAGGRIMQSYPLGSVQRQVDLDLFGDPLSMWGGVIVFGGFTALLVGAALAAFLKRDA